MSANCAVTFVILLLVAYSQQQQVTTPYPAAQPIPQVGQPTQSSQLSQPGQSGLPTGPPVQPGLPGQPQQQVAAAQITTQNPLVPKPVANPAWSNATQTPGVVGQIAQPGNLNLSQPQLASATTLASWAAATAPTPHRGEESIADLNATTTAGPQPAQTSRTTPLPMDATTKGCNAVLSSMGFVLISAILIL